MSADTTSTQQLVEGGQVASRWRISRSPKRQSFEHARRLFLPAALFVQEAPPSPLGRRILWALLLLFVIALAWSYLGRVNIVVTATGHIVPGGQVKLVQAQELATVQAIAVHEGQRVEAGQLLLQLNTNDVDADAQDTQEQLLETRLQIAWREALERWMGRGELAALSFPTQTTDSDRKRFAALLGQQRAEVVARVTGFERQLDANMAEQHSAQSELERARATLQVLDQRVGAYAKLLARQYGAKAQYLAMLQQQTDLKHSLPALAAKKQTLVQTAAAITARMDAYISELRKQNLEALSGLHAQRASLAHLLRKLNLRQQWRRITSPVTGTVQELVLHTIGGVVTPAQTLMKVVPENAPYDVLQNNCSGKHAGMLAACRHHGWPIESYLEPGHPHQQRILQTIAEYSGLAPSEIGVDVDGCSAPVFNLPLRALARMYARFARREKGADLLFRCMSTHPEMVAGSGRFDTAVMQAFRGRLVAKIGAEGLQCFAVCRPRPLGIAIKIEDGNSRAMPPVALRLLLHLGLAEEVVLSKLREFAAPTLRNHRGLLVGHIDCPLDFAGAGLAT